MIGERLLLDTHILLWWVTGSGRLSPVSVDAIGQAADVAVSAVSLWEIVAKESTKHPMVGTDDAYRWFADALAATGFSTVQIQTSHIGQVQHLPLHHRDPFDRLLVAQAAVERRLLVSKDSKLSAYDVAVVW